jgi:hypothetical protein
MARSRPLAAGGDVAPVRAPESPVTAPLRGFPRMNSRKVFPA